MLIKRKDMMSKLNTLKKIKNKNKNTFKYAMISRMSELKKKIYKL